MFSFLHETVPSFCITAQHNVVLQLVCAPQCCEVQVTQFWWVQCDSTACKKNLMLLYFLQNCQPRVESNVCPWAGTAYCQYGVSIHSIKCLFAMSLYFFLYLFCFCEFTYCNDYSTVILLFFEGFFVDIVEEWKPAMAKKNKKKLSFQWSLSIFVFIEMWVDVRHGNSLSQMVWCSCFENEHIHMVHVCIIMLQKNAILKKKRIVGFWF